MALQSALSKLRKSSLRPQTEPLQSGKDLVHNPQKAKSLFALEDNDLLGIEDDELFDDENLIFTLPSSATTTTNSTPSHPETSQGLCTPVPAKPTAAGVAVHEDSSSLQLATSSIGQNSCDSTRGKPVESRVPTKKFQTISKNFDSSSSSLTTAQKLNSFKFVKNSNPRKRLSSDDEVSSSILPKRKSVGVSECGGETLSCQQGLSESGSHEGSKQLSRPFVPVSATPSSALTTPPPSVRTPTRPNLHTGSARPPTTVVATPNRLSPEATPSIMTTPIRSSRTYAAPSTSVFTTTTNPPVRQHNMARVTMPASELTTPSKPPAHQHSIASVISTFRQASSSVQKQPALDNSSKQSVSKNSTPIRKSLPAHSTPLRKQATFPDNATPLRQQSAPEMGEFTTPLNRPSGNKFSTPRQTQTLGEKYKTPRATSHDKCSTPQSTSQNEYSTPQTTSRKEYSPSRKTSHDKYDKYSTPHSASRDEYLTPQPTSRDEYLTPQSTSRDEYLTPQSSSREEYLTPQPTPLVCTPSSGAGSSSGVDILSTPVVLAKRKFPGPAGLLPPLAPGQSMDHIYIAPPSTPVPITTPRRHGLCGAGGGTNKATRKTGGKVRSRSPNNQPDLDGAEFERGPWVEMLQDLDLEDSYSSSLLKYSIASALKQCIGKELSNGKVPHLRAVLKTIVPAGRNASAVLKDPTGEMCTIHSQVLEENQRELQPRAVLVLRQVSTFSPSPRKHYLNITPANVVKVYPPASNLEHRQPLIQVLSAVEQRFADKDCSGAANRMPKSPQTTSLVQVIAAASSSGPTTPQNGPSQLLSRCRQRSSTPTAATKGAQLVFGKGSMHKSPLGSVLCKPQDKPVATPVLNCGGVTSGPGSVRIPSLESLGARLDCNASGSGVGESAAVGVGCSSPADVTPPPSSSAPDTNFFNNLGEDEFDDIFSDMAMEMNT